MKKIDFSTTINAPKEKVWKTLWEKSNYEQWTKVFAAGSTVETDNWKEGSKLQFTDGKGSGMLSEVAVNKPNEKMSFRHLGEVKNGVVDTTSEAVQQWAGAMEEYYLEEKDGKTELRVEMDTAGADFEAFLLKAWPTALETIKKMAEEKTAHKAITVQSTINAPVEKVWETWTEPNHITQWCQASEDWHAPHAENDVRLGGKFKTVMAAKDGSYSFDFGGEYTNVKKYDTIEYDMADGRHVKVKFEKLADQETRVTEVFDMESQNSEEAQRGGWQSILDNFKKYTENSN